VFLVNRRTLKSILHAIAFGCQALDDELLHTTQFRQTLGRSHGEVLTQKLATGGLTVPQHDNDNHSQQHEHV